MAVVGSIISSFETNNISRDLPAIYYKAQATTKSMPWTMPGKIQVRFYL